MQSSSRSPSELSLLQSARFVSGFFTDPIKALRRIHAQHGSFVMRKLSIRHKRVPPIMVMTSDPELYASVLNDPATWQTVNVFPPGRRDHASHRISRGLLGMQGRRHAHYRKLLLPHLNRRSIDELGDNLMQVAQDEIETWPVGRPFDLWQSIRQLVQTYGVALVFGEDREHGCPIAELINDSVRQTGTFGVAFQVNLPGTPYGRWMGRSEVIEEKILEWAANTKNSTKCGRDLFSVIANSSDENGNPPHEATVAEQIPTLLAATYETCQSTLIWTCLLLSQHQAVASKLIDELKGVGGSQPATFDQIMKLPYLDAVVRESMRIVPAVPIQHRLAQRETVLGGREIPIKSRIILSALQANRNPEIYPNPDRFMPERWESISPTQFENPVFSAGPRSCPGVYFANAMLKASLASIFTRYRVYSVKGTTANYRVAVAMAPRREVTMVLEDHGKTRPVERLNGAINDLVDFPNSAN